MTPMTFQQVYRTYNHHIQVEVGGNPSIGWYLYLPFIMRSVAVATAMKLFVHLRIPPEAVQGLIKNIKYVHCCQHSSIVRI